jgi:hypothetical protein
MAPAVLSCGTCRSDRADTLFTLVNPEGNDAGQLHGLAVSRNTGKVLPLGVDGSQLQAFTDRSMPRDKTTKIGDVAAGTYDEIVRGKWAQGLTAANEINKRDFDYKGDDLSYEMIGGNGGQIRNSNSVAHTFGKAMDLDLDGVMRDAGIERKFPGSGRNILDPNYDRSIAPQFPRPDMPRIKYNRKDVCTLAARPMIAHRS